MEPMTIVQSKKLQEKSACDEAFFNVIQFLSSLSLSLALHDISWYYRNIARTDAEAMLRPEAEGCFVVRPGRQMDTFVLSVK